MLINIITKIGDKIHLPIYLHEKKERFIYQLYKFMYHKAYESSLKQLHLLKDIHKGERCFIIGTGPSLNETRLDLIKDEYIIGVNGLINGLEQFNLKNIPYWCISDSKAFNKYGKDIIDRNEYTILFAHAEKTYLDKNKYNKDDKIILIRTNEKLSSNSDIDQGFYYENGTVIVDAIQFAYYLGFEEVYLVGCDSDYSGDGHFDKSKDISNGKSGFKDRNEVFANYKKLKKIFEQNNRIIYNATVGGKLNIFKRRQLDEI